MIRGFLAVFIMVCIFVSCVSPTLYGGDCREDEDCHTEWQEIPGTVCVSGRCTCTNSAYDWCCFRNQIQNCTEEDNIRCRPKEECDPMAPFIFPDAGSDSGSDAGDGG